MDVSAEEIKKSAEGRFKSSWITQTNSINTPIIKHLSGTEQLHYFLYNQTKGFRVFEPDGVEQTPHHHSISGYRFLVITDQRIMYIVGKENEDEIETFVYENITDVDYSRRFIRDQLSFTISSGHKYKFVDTGNQFVNVKNASSYIERRIQETDVKAEPVDEFSSEPTINDAKSSDTSPDDAGSPDSTANSNDSPELLEQILSADKGVTAADKYREEGAIERAVEEYRSAVDQYEAAVDDAHQKETIDRITTSLEEVREKYNETRSLHEGRSSLREQLQSAERSFKEAVGAFIDGSETVANIRFRQARDQYEEALKQVNTNKGLFEAPIEVDAEIAIEHPQQELSEYSHLTTGTLSTLSESGIERLDDIDDSAAAGPMASLFRSDSDSNIDFVEEGEATSTIISWWYNQESVTYTSGDEISFRQKQSTKGFEQT